MSITLDYPVDELRLSELMDDGVTHLRLYSSATPEGPYTYTSVQVALVAATYSYTFTYASGNSALWYKVVSWDGATISDLRDSKAFHGGGGTTLAALVQSTGYRARDLIAATTTGVGNTTSAVVDDVELTRYSTGYFVGWYIQRTDTGAWSQVTAWDASTKTLTFSPAMASVGSGVPIILTKRWTPSEYRRAINWAVRNAYPAMSRSIVYTGLRTQVANAAKIYYYRVPLDMRTINAVEIETDVDLATSATAVDRGHPWRGLAFTPTKDGMEKGFELKHAAPDDRRLRVFGTGPLQQLYEQTDFVEVVDPETELLVYLAASHLYSLLTNEAASTDVDRFADLAKTNMGLYASHKSALAPGRQPQQSWSQQARWSRRDYS